MLQKYYKYLNYDDSSCILNSVLRYVQNTVLKHPLASGLNCLKPLLLLLVVVYATDSLAQEQSVVFGQVLDNASLRPMEGVSVSLVSSQEGTMTDRQGQFRLRVPKFSELRFSSVGYSTQMQQVKGDSMLVFLDPAEVKIEEVVIRAKNINDIEMREKTGSVVEITAKQISNMPTTNLMEVLKGKVTGLEIVQSGELGSAPRVRIRGSASLTQTNRANEPLYVIDGRIVEREVFYNLNLEDVKHLKILKDAAANALYGIQAANGVIEITLKKGYSGPMQLSVSYQTGISLKGRQKFPTLSSAEKLEYERLTKAKVEGYGIVPFFAPGYRYSEDFIRNKYADSELLESKLAEGKRKIDSLSSINTDWYDLLVRSSAYHNYNLSARGGHDANSYYLSLGYNTQGGKLQGNQKDALSLYYNYGYKLLPTMFAGLNTRVSYSRFTNGVGDNSDYSGGANGSLSSTSNLVGASNLVYTLNPYETFDSKQFVSLKGKDLQSVLQHVAKEDNYKQVSLDGVFHYDILPGIRLDMNNGVGLSYTRTKSRVDPLSEIEITNKRGSEKQNRGEHKETTIEKLNYTSNIRFNFTKSLSKIHHLSLSANTDYNYGYTNSLGVSGRGLAYGVKTAAAINQSLKRSNQHRIHSRSLTRATFGWGVATGYTYDDLLDLYGSYKADGSSLLPEDERWNTAWVAGLGIQLARGDFLRHSLKLDNLKLAFNYGRTASIGAVDASFTTPIFRYLEEGHAGMRILELKQLYNQYLKAEQVQSYNASLTLGLWDGRLSFRSDVYQRTTTDAITDVYIQPSNGFPNLKRNVGMLQNTGWEFALSAQVIRTEQFTWSISGNVSYNENTVLDLYDKEVLYESDTPIPLLVEGKSSSTLWGLRSLGINAITGIESFQSPVRDVVAGDKDFALQEGDLYDLGLSSAPYRGGISQRFRYHEFSLGMDFYYEIGHKRRIFPHYLYDNSTVHQNKPKATLALTWFKEGDYGKSIPNPFLSSNAYILPTNKNIADASYIRLGTLYFTYNASALTKKWTNQWMQHCFVSIQSSNLFTYSPFTGQDPEGGSLRTAQQPLITLKLTTRF